MPLSLAWVSQQPFRKNPVLGFMLQGIKGLPNTFSAMWKGSGVTVGEQFKGSLNAGECGSFDACASKGVSCEQKAILGVVVEKAMPGGNRKSVGPAVQLPFAWGRGDEAVEGFQHGRDPF
jgi:hypothetical protein